MLETRNQKIKNYNVFDMKRARVNSKKKKARQKSLENRNENLGIVNVFFIKVGIKYRAIKHWCQKKSSKFTKSY